MIPTLQLGGLGLRRAQAAGGGGGGAPVVTDLFARTLFTGDGTGSIAIAGPDMTGGGLVILKARTNAQVPAFIYSTTGASPQFMDSGGAAAVAAGVTFTSTGATITDAALNVSGRPYVAWFFKKAARFFDVVTYSGNGANRTIAHALGTGVSLMTVKRTDSTTNYIGYHDSLGTGSRINSWSTPGTSAVDANVWNSTAPTSSVFSLGNYTNTNNAAGQFVAFLFAHDTASDGVIRGVDWTGNGSASGPTVACGWQPQGLMVIQNSSSQRVTFDTARTPGFTGNDETAIISGGAAGSATIDHLALTGSGFTLSSTNSLTNGSAVPYYGLAIRVP